MTKLQDREDRLERLWRSIEHLPKDRVFQVVTSFMSNEDLDRALSVNEDKS